MKIPTSTPSTRLSIANWYSLQAGPKTTWDSSSGSQSFAKMEEQPGMSLRFFSLAWSISCSVAPFCSVTCTCSQWEAASWLMPAEWQQSRMTVIWWPLAQEISVRMVLNFWLLMSGTVPLVSEQVSWSMGQSASMYPVQLQNWFYSLGSWHQGNPKHL